MTQREDTGRFTVILNGKSHGLAITYQAILDIENELNIGAVELSHKVRSLRYGLREATVMIGACLRAAGAQAVTCDSVAKEIFETGLTNETVVEALTRIAMQPLFGGQTPQELEKKSEVGP